MSDLLRELADFARLGRDDVYAERRPPNGSDRPKWWYCTRDGKLTEERLRGHLNGGPHLGLYLLSAMSDETRLAVFDLDDHDGDLDPEEMRRIAIELREAALRRGIWTWPLRSGGGHGIHLCARWSEPQSARNVRVAMIAALADVQLRDGAGGIARGEVEVFPKQDAVETGLGSLIALPFGRASVPLDDELRPIDRPMTWQDAEPVAEAPSDSDAPAMRSSHADPTAPIEDIVAALAVIPNDADTDFEAYVAIGMAVYAATGASDEGFAAWDGWSRRRVDKYREADTRERWGYWVKRPDRVTKTGFAALIKRVREHDPNWFPPSNPAPYQSEQWLALKFVAEHRDELRYTALWGHWHIWNGQRWVQDVTLRTFSLAQELCRRASLGVNKSRERKILNKAQTRAAVVSLARENPTLAAVPEQWDADPWLLGTPGGVIDLRTGTLLPHDPERYLTHCCEVAPGGDCPLWKEKLSEICGGNDEFVDFLKRWFGYCLTGLTREEMLTFFIGEGGNGKGTVIETIAWVMGDYAVPVAMTTLVETRRSEHPTEIAKLFKVRLAVASETQDGGRINAAKVKLLTGSDKLTARFMRADYFDFAPTHKLVISGNRPLMLGRKDKAIERRWLTVPFTLSFEPDKTLKERLKAEGPGILAWLIEGCLEWQQRGLVVPQVVNDATEEYLNSQDDLAQFIDEECVVDPPDLLGGPSVTPARIIYEEWRLWCGSSGVYHGSLRDFCDRMKARFKYTNPKGRPTLHGIRLACDVRSSDDETSFR